MERLTSEQVTKMREEGNERQEHAQRGLELVFTIAKEHEAELRAMIEKNEGNRLTTLITEGPLTGATLRQEFESRAKEAGINLDYFYREAGSLSLFGSRHELSAFFQIYFAYLASKKKEDE